MALRVLTMGTFDTIHAGHIGLFNQCRRIVGPDGTVIVGVNSDGFVQKYKGRAPLVTLASRIAVVSALRVVDEAHTNYGYHLQPQLIEDSRPDVIVVGEDWANRNYLEQIAVSQSWLDRRNIQLCYVPRTGDWSSTGIKSRVG